MTKLGFHISDGRGLDWLSHFKSSVHLVLAGSVGGEINRLLQIAEAYPNALLIYRAWDYGAVGHSDHFFEYTKRYGTDPMPLIRIHEPVFNATAAYHKRIAFQLWNETGMDEDIWPQFIEFNVKLINEMDRRGLSASVLGLAPGHPAWSGGRDGVRRAWQQARPLFEALNKVTHPHFINLHEYHAYPWRSFYPWIIGRFEMMLEDVQEMGLLTDKIHIVIGESGFTDPNALGGSYPSGPNGYRWSLAQGHNPEQLADDYTDMLNVVYNPSSYVTGLCYFSLGDSGNWAEFDLLNEPRILDRLERLQQVAVQIIPTDNVDFSVLVTTLNVRTAPSFQGQVVDTKNQHDVVTTNGYADADGYRWRRLVSGGFCAELNISTAEKLMEVSSWKNRAFELVSLLRLYLDELENLLRTN